MCIESSSGCEIMLHVKIPEIHQSVNAGIGDSFPDEKLSKQTEDEFMQGFF